MTWAEFGSLKTDLAATDLSLFICIELELEYFLFWTCKEWNIQKDKLIKKWSIQSSTLCKATDFVKCKMPLFTYLKKSGRK